MNITTIMSSSSRPRLTVYVQVPPSPYLSAKRSTKRPNSRLAVEAVKENAHPLTSPSTASNSNQWPANVHKRKVSDDAQYGKPNKRIKGEVLTSGTITRRPFQCPETTE